MRKYIRHPSSIPIHCHLKDVVTDAEDYLKDISVGGLCFTSMCPLPEGSVIVIEIPIRKPEVSLEGQVVWCKEENERCYSIGVQFKDQATDFQVRMVEQVCYIEEYKDDVLREEGRRLTGEEAALEWIRKYAGSFPSLT